MSVKPQTYCDICRREILVYTKTNPPDLVFGLHFMANWSQAYETHPGQLDLCLGCTKIFLDWLEAARQVKKELR